MLPSHRVTCHNGSTGTQCSWTAVAFRLSIQDGNVNLGVIRGDRALLLSKSLHTGQGEALYMMSVRSSCHNAPLRIWILDASTEKIPLGTKAFFKSERLHRSFFRPICS